jgi:hypothetical protein
MGLDYQEAWGQNCVWWNDDCPFADTELLGMLIAPSRTRHDWWVETESLELCGVS